MSVTQPADSGGTNALQSLQVDKKMEDINHQIGSWAQLMEEEDEEHFIEGSPDEDEGTDEIDGGGAGETSSKSPEKRKRVPDEAPFRVQVTNISINHNEEELLYYFGGDQHIKRVSFQREKGRAEFEFITRDGLLAALERDELDFQNITLRVFALRNNVGRVSGRHSNDYNYGSHDSHRQYNNHHNQYQNQYHHNNRRYQNDHRGSHYNSQSSLGSDKNPRNYDKGYRENRYSQNHYGTMPAGGYHDKRGGFANRGGYNHYNNDRNSFRGPKNPNYERQNSGPNPHQYRDRYEGGGGPIQRSGSYQHQRNNDYRHGPPQPISSRNRTESHSTNFDQYSRASSRMSIDEAGAPKQIQRKVSANPFGDAKPVDTSTKLLEIEKRQAEKDRIEKEAAAAAAATAAAAKQSNSNLAATGDGGNDEQQQQHHQHHHNNHHNHHQHGDQHSNNSRHSKKSKKSSSSTGSYHQDGERRPSFDQGALPGTVIIKKREPTTTTDADKQRDEECSTPPVDPYQYPSNQDAEKQQEQPPTNALPPPPPPSSNSQHHHQRSGSTKNHQQVRPSAKPYVPKGGVLQKSATVGQMENQQHENQHRKDGVGKFNRNYSGTGVRRPSFSGSDGGGGKQSSRGTITKRGGRGGGGNAGNNNSSRDQKSNRGKPQQQQQEAKKEEVKEVEQQPTAPPPPPTPAEPVVEAAKVEAQIVQQEVEKSSTTAAVATNPATPTPKKKDKKKDKKKELSHMSSNKYAALLNCPQ